MITTRLRVLYTVALALTAAVCPYQDLNAQEEERTIYTAQTTYTARLEKSRAVWEALKDRRGGHYEYSRSFQSWVGYKHKTTITVKDDIVAKRKCKKKSPHFPSEQQQESWTEGEGSEVAVGHHSDCHPAKTVDELYDICENDVLTRDEDNHKISLEFDDNGVLKRCTYFHKRCADDCTRGVTIEELRFLEDTEGAQQGKGKKLQESRQN